MEARFLMPELLDFYTELAEHNEKSWFDGHKRRYLDIKAYYESLGMEILEGLCKFDPNLENAVMRGTSEEGEPGTVCMVLQKGYQMGGVVLRHAMVKVVSED